MRLHHEGHERFAGVRYFRIVEGKDREGELQFRRLADRADRMEGVVHVLGDRLLLGVARGAGGLGGDIDRDAVRRQMQVAG